MRVCCCHFLFFCSSILIFFFFVAPRGKIILVKKKKKILHKVLFISWMLHEKGKNITTILLMTLHLINFYQSCKENLMLWKGKKSKNWVRVYLFIWLSPNFVKKKKYRIICFSNVIFFFLTRNRTHVWHETCLRHFCARAFFFFLLKIYGK